MECNKEEAVRAKDIAEKKMQGKDFRGARKIALKAQQLFPALENISQMLTVCEVHCAEAIKVNNQVDWYGILQVDPTADEVSIKKQYRRLAFLLHPDKNKFAGAEAAFKLVGEAHGILGDRAKRSLYDAKRRTSIRSAPVVPPPQKPSPSPYATAPCGVSSQQPQQSQTAGSQTFWTFCPFCGIRYQYYRSTMCRAVRCQSCTKTFIAYDMNARDPSARMQPSFTTQQSGVPLGNGFAGGNTFNSDQASSTARFRGNTAPGPWSRSRMNTEFGGTSGNATNTENQSHVDPPTEKEVKFEKVTLEKADSKVKAAKSSDRPKKAAQSSGSTKRKRVKKNRRNASDDDEECSFADSSDSDEEINDETNGSSWSAMDTSGSKNPRRSTRQKQNVTYAEDQSDDDDYIVRSSKRSRKTESSSYAVLSDDDDGTQGFKHEKDDLQKTYETKVENSIDGSQVDHKSEEREVDGSAAQEDTDDFSYPDPQFYDFDQDRGAEVFKSGQIWALYDDVDGMPRFYVRISTVLKQNFKVKFSWLELDPEGQVDEREWSAAGLPVACGSFNVCNDKPQTTDNRGMFSYMAYHDKSRSTKKFVLHPRKGQVWALYRGWEIKWSSALEKHKPFEYEVVEIISEDAEGWDVAILVKVGDFVSLFARDTRNSILHIPRSDKLRFSHMIPSYRMSGKEAEGIREGLYELDPAALPLHFLDKFPSLSLEEINRGNVDSEIKMTSSTKSTTGVDTAGSIYGHPEDKKCHKVNQFPASNTKFSSSSAEMRKFQNLDSSSSMHSEEIQNGNDSLPTSCGFNNGAVFHDFGSERSISKIKKGQIWALYSRLDGFPKDYVFVRDVQEKSSEVHITRLEGCPTNDFQMRWLEKKLPITCGRFKFSSGRGSKQVLGTLAVFSHLVQYTASPVKNQYDIYPCSNEVWALYKNWSPEWLECNAKRCSDYNVVEVLTMTNSTIVVMLLEKKSHFKSVFAPKISSSETPTLEIPLTELQRFSHRIPSFRLTGGMGRQLDDTCWELDSASLPAST